MQPPMKNPTTPLIKRGAIGVLQQSNRLLLIRRAECVAKGGFWCFPGGHLDPGENSRDAVVRELAEELGIEVKPLTRLGTLRVIDSGHLLVVWTVSLIGGSLQLAEDEVAEVAWMTPREIVSIDKGLPTNIEVLRFLGLDPESKHT